MSTRTRTPSASTFAFSATSDPDDLIRLQENPRQETAGGFSLPDKTNVTTLSPSGCCVRAFRATALGHALVLSLLLMGAEQKNMIYSCNFIRYQQSKLQGAITYLMLNLRNLRQCPAGGFSLSGMPDWPPVSMAISTPDQVRGGLSRERSRPPPMRCPWLWSRASEAESRSSPGPANGPIRAVGKPGQKFRIEGNGAARQD